MEAQRSADQALYLRVEPAITSCCRATVAVEIHRVDGQQEIYCTACLGHIYGGIPFGGHIRRMGASTEWPWVVPATPIHSCGTCGKDAGPLPAVNGNGYVCEECIRREAEAAQARASARAAKEEKRVPEVLTGARLLAWLLFGIRPKG
jgi:hypothetical protein